MNRSVGSPVESHAKRSLDFVDTHGFGFELTSRDTCLSWLHVSCNFAFLKS